MIQEQENPVGGCWSGLDACVQARCLRMRVTSRTDGIVFDPKAAKSMLVDGFILSPRVVHPAHSVSQYFV